MVLVCVLVSLFHYSTGCPPADRAETPAGGLQVCSALIKQKQYLKSTATKLKLGHKTIFQIDDDPKHTTKLFTMGLKDKKVNALEVASESLDLNPKVGAKQGSLK